MPRHQQITTCRKSGGPTSKHCSCEHCALSVCAVCGGGEGSLTTDCPGTQIDADRQQELCETNLDYTDARGWHLADEDCRRAPHFERTRVEPEPPRTDPRALIAPDFDWAVIDRNVDLERDLALKAIRWVLAERICEDHSAALVVTEDEIDGQLADGNAPADVSGALLARRERERIDFQISSKRAEVADDEFRQAARQLVAALEEPRSQIARQGLTVPKAP